MAIMKLVVAQARMLDMTRERELRIPFTLQEKQGHLFLHDTSESCDTQLAIYKDKAIGVDH